MSHFVLVHGACHGAWCWYKLATLLKSEGHTVSAVDLAASGINLKPLEDVKTVSDYMEPLMAFMSGLLPDEKVVLVGHSMGGIAVSVAMEKYPSRIKVAVFVTAFMPGPDLSFRQIKYECNPGSSDPANIEFGYGNGSSNPPTSFLHRPDYLASRLYHVSPPEDINLRIMLGRPCPSFSDADSEKELLVTHEKYGTVRRVYIMCGEDKTMKVEIQRYMISKNPPNEVMKIPDSDHMPMFCKPLQLCSYFLQIAKNY